MFPSGWCFSTLSPRAGFLTSAFVRIQSINQINQQTSGCMSGKFSVLYNQHECGESAGWRGIGRPNSRDQILRRLHRQGHIQFPCSADHEQDWQPYPVDPHSAIRDDHT